MYFLCLIIFQSAYFRGFFQQRECRNQLRLVPRSRWASTWHPKLELKEGGPRGGSPGSTGVIHDDWHWMMQEGVPPPFEVTPQLETQYGWSPSVGWTSVLHEFYVTWPWHLSLVNHAVIWAWVYTHPQVKSKSTSMLVSTCLFKQVYLLYLLYNYPIWYHGRANKLLVK